MSKKVALALSSGGARGLAHIGVINELEHRGFEITSIAGSSMGALVGAMYSAGTLKEYEKWVRTLNRMDVLALVDFTLGVHGFIKGEKIFEEMQRLGFVPAVNIEDLKIPTVILSTDILNGKEIIFSSGPLSKALRASVSIPGVFTPIEAKDFILMDGGILNPLPLRHLDKSKSDLVVAVDTNALIPYKPSKKRKTIVLETDEEKSIIAQLKEKWFELFEGNERKKLTQKNRLNYFDMTYRVIQVMLSSLTEQAIRETPPDVLVRISKDACGIFEFYRADEVIDLGREKCKEVLDTNY
jgi:NTE family protein